jgi:hypothetical protein
MMRRGARSVALLVTLHLIIFVTSASAECAWVLWLGTAGVAGVNDTTVILQATETRQACDVALSEAMSFWKRDPSPNMSVGEDSVVITGVKFQILRYMCLPDTVDPRGPKGTK